MWLIYFAIAGFIGAKKQHPCCGKYFWKVLAIYAVCYSILGAANWRSQLQSLPPEVAESVQFPWGTFIGEQILVVPITVAFYFLSYFISKAIIKLIHKK